MGKNNNRHKRKHQDIISLAEAPDVDISLLDISTTVRTLKQINKNPNMLRAPKFRDLRVALHPIIEESLKKRNEPSGNNGGEMNLNLTGASDRISEAMETEEYDMAIHNLRVMEFHKTKPKLGAVQRWMRFLNCDTTKKTPEERKKIEVLSHILRVTNQFFDASTHNPHVASRMSNGTIPSKEEGEEEGERDLLIPHPPFNLSDKKNEGEQEAKNLDQVREQKRSKTCLFRVVGRSMWQQGVQSSKTEEEEGEEGGDVPSTGSSLPIMYAEPHTIDFSLTNPEGGLMSKAPGCEKPFINGSLLLTNILSRDECERIISCAEQMGFHPDERKGPSALEWLADETFVGPIFERCKPFLPDSLCGDELCGINSRFRIYRYDAKTIYRPHIDGAWPGSGLVDGKYCFKAFPDQRSRMTCIIYLNENMEGGETNFFLADRKEEGKVHVHSCKPQQGHILLFPHGDTSDFLVHEGNVVTKGKKYIIRTEILYTTKEE